MVELSLQLEGFDELRARFLLMPGKVLIAMRDAIAYSGHRMELAAKQAITSGPTRAIDTGRLRSELIPRDMSINGLSVSIYPLVEYGLYVHEGTSRMAARPFFKVAVLEAGPDIEKAFQTQINKALG